MIRELVVERDPEVEKDAPPQDSETHAVRSTLSILRTKPWHSSLRILLSSLSVVSVYDPLDLAVYRADPRIDGDTASAECPIGIWLYEMTLVEVGNEPVSVVEGVV